MQIEQMEERAKDSILQKINDILEEENWGKNTQSLSVEIFFTSGMECDIFVRYKNKVVKKTAS